MSGPGISENPQLGVRQAEQTAKLKMLTGYGTPTLSLHWNRS